MSTKAQIFNGVDAEFLTTASFRRAGQYVISPEIYLIVQSLLNRWNNFSTAFTVEFTVEGEDLPQVLSNFVKVRAYNFYSQNFWLENQKIDGFCGTMSADFKGKHATKNLLGLLLEYVNYCGVGIKTALGMGAIKTKMK